MLDLTRLDGLNTVQYSLGDLTKTGWAYRNGDIGTLVSDAKSRNNKISHILYDESGQKATYLLTALTIAAVPLPKTSLSLPCFCNSTN
jgi:hypothetical protein